MSVVTATYSGDDPGHLAEAVDSVIAQSHRPLQYLIVCDGPLTDAQRDVLRVRSDAHDWIEVRELSGPRGPAGARNAVLPDCRGDIIAILDADDAMAPTRLAEQVAALADGDGDVDLVASWLQVVHLDGSETETRQFPVDWRRVRAKAPYFCPTANTAMAFRAAVLPHFRYPELRVGEDYRLWVDLMRAGFRIGNIPRPLTRYRAGSGSMVRRRGWAYARSDLATKLHALPLAAAWQWPFVVLVAGVTFIVRLLPADLFRGAYAVFEKVTR
ncbi:MAG: glycosyltransferase [Candidatus Nanopelagicales bacterium]